MNVESFTDEEIEAVNAFHKQYVLDHYIATSRRWRMMRLMSMEKTIHTLIQNELHRRIMAEKPQ